MRTITSTTVLGAVLAVVVTVHGKHTGNHDAVSAAGPGSVDMPMETATTTDWVPTSTANATDDTDSPRPVFAGTDDDDEDDTDVATPTDTDPTVTLSTNDPEVTDLVDDLTSLDDDPTMSRWIADETATWLTWPAASTPFSPPPIPPKFTTIPSPVMMTPTATTTVPHTTPTNVQAFSHPSLNAAPGDKAASLPGLTVGMFAGVIAILL